MDALLEMLPLLIPILVLDAVLAVVAALHVLRHPHYRVPAHWPDHLLCYWEG